MGLADNIVKRQEDLQAARSTWESLWQDIPDYVLPAKAGVTSEDTPGTRKGSLIYDSTPQKAVNVSSAGLMSHMTSIASPWFALRTRNEGLMEDGGVKWWLQEAERRMFAVYNSSNFYTSIHEYYQDLIAFGTASIFVEEDPEFVVRFSVFPIKQIFIAENYNQQIDTVYRVYKQTARQLVQEFGEDHVSRNTIEKAREKPDTKVDCIHAVFPRKDRDIRLKTRVNMPFASIYLEKGEKHILDDGGYLEMPWMVARWSKGSREIYGRCPAIDVMPDIKTLHQMERTNLRQAEKAADPPLLVHADYTGRVRTKPGGINYYRDPNKVIRQMDVAGNIPVALEMVEQKRQSIREAFFVDVFLMLSQENRGKQPITATEVVERVQERLMILGPVLGRLHSEALGPLVERSFSVMLRANFFPPLPEELLGQELDVEYLSPLAKAQKAMEARSTQEAMLFIQQLLGVSPDPALAQELMDNIDVDKYVKKAWDIFGAPAEIMRDPEERDGIREQRAQAQQMQQMMLAAQQGADIGKTASEIENAGG